MHILRFLYELIPCLLLGYWIGHFRKELSSKIAPPLINLGVPLSLMGLLLKSGIDRYLLDAFVMSILAIGILITAIRLIPSLNVLIGVKTLLLGSTFGNSGYFGIPISLAVLPSDSLSFSIGYDLGATMLIWSLGPILLNNYLGELKPKGLLTIVFKALITSPTSKAILGVLLINLTPFREDIASYLWTPSRIVIVLALLIVGMRLGSLGVFKNLNPPKMILLIKPSLILKLIILPLVMLILSLAFSLPLPMRNALVLQAATPTAISVLLIAEASKQEQEIAAYLVSWSTLISVFTISIWLLLLS